MDKYNPLVNKFVKAAFKGDLKAVKKCLEKGVDIYAEVDKLTYRRNIWSGYRAWLSDCTALGAAAFQGHVPVVQFLVNMGATARGDCGAEKLARKQGNHQCADIIAKGPQAVIPQTVAEGARLAKKLAEAAQEGNLRQIDWCLKMGADIDKLFFLRHQWGKNVYSDHVTPLMLAARNGRALAVQTLLVAGSGVSLCSSCGFTASDFAQHEGNIALARYLREASSASQPVSAPEKIETPSPVAEGLADGWKKLDANRLTHVETLEPLGQRLTEIFNFKRRERILITRDLGGGAQSTATDGFDRLDRAILEEALKEFKEQGGDADERYVFHGNAPGLPKERLSCK